MAGTKKKVKTVKQQSSSSVKDPATTASEIDEIFSRCNKKTVSSQKPSDDANQKKRKQETSLKHPTKQKKTQVSTEEPAEKPFLHKPRRKTEDGLTVYTEEEIGWNKKNAGGTPLCPFDCDCCF